MANSITNIIANQKVRYRRTDTLKDPLLELLVGAKNIVKIYHEILIRTFSLGTLHQTSNTTKLLLR